MPRKRLPPDCRPDWRDPNMPVLVQHRTKGLIPIEPKRLQRVCEVRLAICPEPNYRDDPTYNLAKRKASR